MTQPSRIVRGSAHQERILELAKSLSDDFTLVTLEEIDGEFYWRFVRHDLFEPLRKQAAIIAPHLVGLPPSGQFDNAQRQEITRFRESALADSRIDAGTRQFALDIFKKQLKERELRVAAQDIIARLPPFVWTRFRNRQRIPLHGPLEAFFLDGGKVLEVRVYSRHMSGAELEAFLEDHHRGRIGFRSDPDPAVAEQAQNQVVSEVNAGPTSRVEIRASFDLVQVGEPSLAIETSGTMDVVPFIQVILPRPLPPMGYLGPAYDTFLQNQQLLMHQVFHGDVTNQEKYTAIWTWAIGLLMASRLTFNLASQILAERVNLHGAGSSPSYQWFLESRITLLQRVPSAEDALRVRSKRSKTQSPS